MAKISAISALSKSRVSHVVQGLLRAGFHFGIADQRWYMFQKMGPAPSARSGHAMASMGSRVFVLGGLGGASLDPAKPEDPSLVHVLDTSKRFVVSLL